MKKLLVFLLLVALMGASVYSDADDELGYREAGLSRANLYPEGNFDNYPSRLTQLEKQLLRGNFYLDMSGFGDDVDTQKGGPTDGGILTSRPGDWEFEINGSYFFKPTSELTLGFRLDDNFSFETFQNDTDDGFSTAGQTVEVVRKDTQISLAPQIFFAMPLGVNNMNMGGSLYFSTLLDPVEEEFTQRTDSALNGGTMFYSEAEGTLKNDDGNSRLGATFSLDGTVDRLEWGASLTGSYAWDENKRKASLDADNDTFNDTIVDEAAYQTDPNGGGLAFYERKNLNTTIQVALNGYAKYALSEKDSVIVTAQWYPVSSWNLESFTHTVSTDKSIYTNTYSTGLSNLNLTGAYATNLSDKWTLRAGAGAGFWLGGAKQENLDANGTSTYASGNTGKVNQGNEGVGWSPTDDFLVGGNGTMTELFELNFPMEIEVRFTPAKEVTLFSSFNTTIQSRAITYQYYNIDDDTLWSEKGSTLTMVSNNRVAGGLDLALTDALNLVIWADARVFDPDLSFTKDMLPYDASGTIDGVTNDRSNDAFTLYANFVLRY